ncbi:hypothetical protein [Clostridium sp. LCP25S3_F8]|uniref:hypothetical protein n=1 Tax=Clostridium sp. LCP25S3_F8 TaxID=3438751 RepID=UPI003F9059CD
MKEMRIGVSFEMKKFKGTYYFLISIMSTIFLVALQGYMGYVITAIEWKVLYITAMDLFTYMLLPAFLSIFIGISFYEELRKRGNMNSIYKGMTNNEIIENKLKLGYLYGILLFFIGMLISSIYMIIRGGNPIDVYIHNYDYIILMILTVLSIINWQVVLTIFLKNSIIPVIIAMGLSVFQVVLNAMNLWIINPYGYLNNLFSIHQFKLREIIAVCIVDILSFYLVKRIKLKTDDYMMED